MFTWDDMATDGDMATDSHTPRGVNIRGEKTGICASTNLRRNDSHASARLMHTKVLSSMFCHRQSAQLYFAQPNITHDIFSLAASAKPALV